MLYFLAMRVPLGKTPRKTLGKRFCLYFPLPRVFPLRKTPRKTLGNASPCGKPWGKPRGKPWVRHGDILMFPGFFPWGNPYYSPWGKPCRAQFPLLFPLGKTLGSPLGKTPRKSSDSRPPGFPPWGKVCISPGGQGPPRGNPWAGPHFLWKFRNGKTILEKSAGRFGAKWKSDAPKRCGLGIL